MNADAAFSSPSTRPLFSLSKAQELIVCSSQLGKRPQRPATTRAAAYLHHRGSGLVLWVNVAATFFVRPRWKSALTKNLCLWQKRSRKKLQKSDWERRLKIIGRQKNCDCVNEKKSRDYISTAKVFLFGGKSRIFDFNKRLPFLRKLISVG
jgi:hypothetical protein